MGRVALALRLLSDAVGVALAVLLWLLIAPVAWVRARGLRVRMRSPEGCRLLMLQPNVARAVMQHGPQVIEANLRCAAAAYSVVLDARGELEHASQLDDAFRFVSWKAPAWADAIGRAGLHNTAYLLGEVPVLFKMLSFAAQESFTAVKSSMHNEAALRGFVVCGLLRLPHIIDIAGNYDLIERLTGHVCYLGSYYRFRLARPMVRAVSRWLVGLPLRHAFRVLGRNKNNYEHAFSLGASIERLSLLRIRVTPQFLEFRREQMPESPLPQRYMLFVARLSPEKRPEDAIAAFEGVAAEVSDVHLVIIGDGPLRTTVERRASQSAFSTRIHLTGALPNLDVLRWTAHAAVAVELYSGSSLVEKMLCAVPVVAYDIEWMSEVVIDGYTGFSVDYLDIEGLSRRCAQLIADPQLARELGQRARDLALAMFDLQRIKEREDRYLLEADGWYRSARHAVSAGD